MPQTNNPDPLLSGLSPFADLLGVRYILSTEPLDYSQLDIKMRNHIRSLRWIRYLNSMVNHSVKGRLQYGYSGDGGFAFFFSPPFRFKTKIRVSEPFFVFNYAISGAANGNITIDVNGETILSVRVDIQQRELWVDISRFLGRDVVIEIKGGGDKGVVSLIDLGLSKGADFESRLYSKLLELYRREIPYLDYKGMLDKLYVYENKNVMSRAFVIKKAEFAKDLSEVIDKLQNGKDFRSTVLIVSDNLPGELQRGNKGDDGDKLEEAIIKRYSPNEVIIEARSEGGVLVLSDLYYPGWKVVVNGKEAPVLKAYGLLRGVVIPRGRSTVIFNYRPYSFYAGIFISLLSLLFLPRLYFLKSLRRND